MDGIVRAKDCWVELDCGFEKRKIDLDKVDRRKHGARIGPDFVCSFSYGP